MLNDNDVVVARGTLFPGPDGKLLPTLHLHTLEYLQQKGGKPTEEYVVVRISSVDESHRDDPYPYYMEGAEVPTTLSDLYPMNNYVWDFFRLRRAQSGSSKTGASGDTGDGPPPPSESRKSMPVRIEGEQDTEDEDLPPIPRLDDESAQAQLRASVSKAQARAQFPPKPSQVDTPMDIEPRTGALLSPPPLAKSPSPVQNASASGQAKPPSQPSQVDTPMDIEPRRGALLSPPPLAKSPSPIQNASASGQAKPPSQPSRVDTPMQIARAQAPGKAQPPPQPSPGGEPMDIDRPETTSPVQDANTAGQAQPVPSPDSQPMDIDRPVRKEIERSENETGAKPVSSSGKPRSSSATPVSSSVPPQDVNNSEGTTKPADGKKEVNRERNVENIPPSAQTPEDIDTGNYTDEEKDRLPSAVAGEEDIAGIDEDELAAEGPGDQINVPYTRNRDTYDRKLIRVRIDQLVYPPNVTRELDMKHVGMLKRSLREDGVDYSLGYISVCYKPSEKPYTPTRYPPSKFEGIVIDEPENMTIDGEDVSLLQAFFVINAMHRGNAIDRLFAEAKELRDRDEYGVINVMLFSRKNKAEMTFYELLAIGGVVNDTGTVTKKPTFADQIQLCISCIREIRRLNPNINLTSVSLGKKFKDDAIIRANHDATHQRYARASLTFADNVPLHYRFKEYWCIKRNFGITHFQCSSFHRALNSEEQLVALDALHDYLMQPSSGSFTYTAGTHFFQEIRQLLDVVSDFAKKKEESLSDFLKESVQITKNNFVPVSSQLIRTVCRFQANDRLPQMVKKSSNRIKRFKTILFEAFFPKSEEEKRAEAEEAKRKAEEKRREEEQRQMSRRAAKTKARSVTAQMMAATTKVTTKRKKPQASKKQVKQAKYSTEPGVDFTVVVQDVVPFDDDVPSRYPNRYNVRPTKWNGPKEWVELLTTPPHRVWSEDMCVKNPEPWLHGMGVPRKHRAHLFLSAQDLQRNHHAVYYHAALQAALNPSVLNNMLYKSSDDDDPLSTAKRIAMRHPELSEGYLATCREEVMHKGYCVIEGIFNDSNIPPGPVVSVYDQNPANKVAEFYASHFPTQQEMKSEQASNKYWSAIFNNSTDSAKAVRETGQGRFSTTKDGLFKHIEMDDNTVEIARYRSALDIRALQICVAMGLEESCAQMLAIPCTGSRILASKPGCERQLAHCDFISHADAYDSFSPRPVTDYSVIWTADDPFPIILWEYSHILQCGTRVATKKIEEAAYAKRVVVPPFSCVVFRGDLLHAGPGGQDRTAAEKEALHHSSPLRFHIYVIRWGVDRTARKERTTDAPFVPDNVFFVDKFQPMVQKDPEWIEQKEEE